MIVVHNYKSFTFTFKHLADTFIQSVLQMRRAIEAGELTIGQKDASDVTVVYSIAVYVMFYVFIYKIDKE